MRRKTVWWLCGSVVGRDGDGKMDSVIYVGGEGENDHSNVISIRVNVDLEAAKDD